MPVHHIPRASLHEDLLRLDREGERVDSITNDATDPDRYVVVTSFKDGGLELRGAAL